MDFWQPRLTHYPLKSFEDYNLIDYQIVGGIETIVRIKKNILICGR